MEVGACSSNHESTVAGHRGSVCSVRSVFVPLSLQNDTVSKKQTKAFHFTQYVIWGSFIFLETLSYFHEIFSSQGKDAQVFSLHQQVVFTLLQLWMNLVLVHLSLQMWKIPCWNLIDIILNHADKAKKSKLRSQNCMNASLQNLTVPLCSRQPKHFCVMKVYWLGSCQLLALGTSGPLKTRQAVAGTEV